MVDNEVEDAVLVEVLKNWLAIGEREEVDSGEITTS